MGYDLECISESVSCKYDSDKNRNYTSRKIISKKEHSDMDGAFSTEVHSNFFYQKNN